MAKGKRTADEVADIRSSKARGGRVRFDGQGRPVFIIRRQINGRRYEVSTRAHTLKAAGEHVLSDQSDRAGPGAGVDCSYDLPVVRDLAYH